MIFNTEISKATKYHKKFEDIFLWNCFGNSCYIVDCDINDEESISFVYNYCTGAVSLIMLIDYKTEQFFKWISPHHFEEYEKECIKNNSSIKFVDNRNEYTLINDEQAILEKINDIFKDINSNCNTEDIELDLDEDIILELTNLAHKRNINFNQIVHEALNAHVSMLSKLKNIDN